jgi:flagellar biosynthesis protein FlhB
MKINPFIPFERSKLFLSLSRNDDICLMIHEQPSFPHLSPAFSRKHLGFLSTAIITSEIGFLSICFYMFFFKYKIANNILSHHSATKMFFSIMKIPYFSQKIKPGNFFFNTFFSADNFFDTAKYPIKITVACRMADTGFSPPRSLGLEPIEKSND